jgi:hypothetical protein
MTDEPMAETDEDTPTGRACSAFIWETFLKDARGRSAREQQELVVRATQVIDQIMELLLSLPIEAFSGVLAGEISVRAPLAGSKDSLDYRLELRHRISRKLLMDLSTLYLLGYVRQGRLEVDILPSPTALGFRVSAEEYKRLLQPPDNN